MSVKVKIPTSLDDITISQFQRLDKLNKSDLKDKFLDNEILKLFTGIENVESITKKDRDSILNSVGEALTKQGEFKQRFTLNGIEFGMIPNFDKMIGGEYSDLIKYYNDIDNLHRFMAVAFRPIKLKDVFKNYQIVKYNGTGETSDIMLECPMSIVKGFDIFFLNLSNDLENHIQKSMQEELTKAM